MRALTLTQPWAALVMLGVKHVETRSWTTEYRGPLVIHAAKGHRGSDDEFAALLARRGILHGPIEFGCALGTVRLIGVLRTERYHPAELERELGDFGAGRFAWLLEDPQPFAEPVLCKGALGLWQYAGAMP